MDPSMRLEPNDSYLTCLPLKLLKMKGSVVRDMIAKGKKEIRGRGYPMLYKNVDVREEMKKLNYTFRQARRNRQKMIPFILDLPGYIYVVARRTHYIVRGHKITDLTHYKQHCYDHRRQIIDKEVADLVIVN